MDTGAAEVFAKAEAARKAGELSEAEHLLREGLAARKGDVQLSNLLAIVLHARGQRVESVALLRQIVRDHPLATVPRWNLALALEAATLKAEARRQFATYLKIDPESAYAAQARNKIEALEKDLGQGER